MGGALKQAYFLALLGFVLVSPALAFDQAALDASIRKQNTEEIKKRAEEISGCMSSSGTWRWMPTPCTGKCDFNVTQACLAVLAMGCDCGAQKCFDRETNTCR